MLWFPSAWLMDFEQSTALRVSWGWVREDEEGAGTGWRGAIYARTECRKCRPVLPFMLTHVHDCLLSSTVISITRIRARSIKMEPSDLAFENQR